MATNKNRKSETNGKSDEKNRKKEKIDVKKEKSIKKSFLFAFLSANFPKYRAKIKESKNVAPYKKLYTFVSMCWVMYRGKNVENINAEKTVSPASKRAKENCFFIKSFYNQNRLVSIFYEITCR